MSQRFHKMVNHAQPLPRPRVVEGTKGHEGRGKWMAEWPTRTSSMMWVVKLRYATQINKAIRHEVGVAQHVAEVKRLQVSSVAVK